MEEQERYLTDMYMLYCYKCDCIFNPNWESYRWWQICMLYRCRCDCTFSPNW